MKNLFLFLGKSILAGLFLFLGGYAHAQSFIQEVPYAEPQDGAFVQHSVANYDEGYVVAGTVIGASPPHGSDIRVMMGDNAGNILWSRYVDYGFDEFAGSVIVDRDGNIVITGYTGRNGTGNKNLILVKLDNNGNLVNDVVIEDAGLLGYGLYGLDLVQAEPGYVVVGTGVDDATQNADKYAFALLIDQSLTSIAWGRKYQSTNATFIYDSFNHVLKVDHPTFGETYLLTGSGAENSPPSFNQMVTSDLIRQNGISIWDPTPPHQARGIQETHTPIDDNIGVMALYKEEGDRFFVLYYGREDIPGLLELNGTTGAPGSNAFVTFYQRTYGDWSNVFSGMRWSTPAQEEITLSGYHIDADNPPGDGYPILVRYDISQTVASQWSRYLPGHFDGAQYANIGFDFIVDPINRMNPNSPYDLNQSYYHPKGLAYRYVYSPDPAFLFAAPQQDQSTSFFGLNLLHTGIYGEMACEEVEEGLDEGANLATFNNFTSQAYNFAIIGQGAMVSTAPDDNTLICEESIPRSQMGINKKPGNSRIKAYPNPAKDHLTVTGLPKRGHLSLSLYDMQGRTVITQALPEGSPNSRLDVSGLPDGVYFLQVTEAGKVLYTQRVVKR